MYPHTNTALSSQFHKQNGNAFRLDAKIKPTEARKHKLFETVEFQVTTGQIIPCARKGLVLIPIAKVAIYAMGKVEMYPKQELRQLQELKQRARKEFDKSPDNQQRLEHIKKLRHNYERSQEMFESIKKIGFTDSVEAINNIISHLLSVGESVTSETRVNYPSDLEGQSGLLRVLSTWTLLPDGTRYLSTIKFIPKQGA